MESDDDPDVEKIVVVLSDDESEALLAAKDPVPSAAAAAAADAAADDDDDDDDDGAIWQGIRADAGGSRDRRRRGGRNKRRRGIRGVKRRSSNTLDWVLEDSDVDSDPDWKMSSDDNSESDGSGISEMSVGLTSEVSSSLWDDVKRTENSEWGVRMLVAFNMSYYTNGFIV